MIDTTGYGLGDTIMMHKPRRIERNYSGFYRPEFLSDTQIPFVVGVTSPEWLEAEMKRREYRPMVGTRFNPARLPR